MQKKIIYIILDVISLTTGLHAAIQIDKAVVPDPTVLFSVLAVEAHFKHKP